MSGSIYLAIPILLFLGVLQTAVLPLFPIFGLVPQLPVLAALSWGLLRGPQEGIGWAFVGGLCLDIFSAGPLGANAMALMVAVFVTAFAQENLPKNRFVLPIVLGGAGSLLFLMVYAVIVRIAGQPVPLGATAVFFPLALLQGFFILPIYWAEYQLVRVLYPARVTTVE